MPYADLEKRRLRDAQYRAKNSLAIKESKARSHAKNPLARKERTARYRAKNQLAIKESKARSRAKNYEYYQNDQLERKYGLSIAERQKMFDNQAGLCAICGDFMESPHVDHNHATGKVRGLLCRECNAGIGFLKDNPTICSVAAEYLKEGV